MSRNTSVSTALFYSHPYLSGSLFFALTFFLAFWVVQIEISSDFKKLLPLEHPYLQNMIAHEDDLNLGQEVRLIVEAKGDSIFDDRYLRWIETLTNTVFDLPHVDKSRIKSLWTPNARWIAVTEDGFQGGQIIPAHLDSSAESLVQIRQNIERSGEIGRLVADDFKSSTVYVPLVWGQGDQSIDYRLLSERLEALRAQSRAFGYDMHIIGVPKKIGDLIQGAQQMGIFFFYAVFLIFLILFLYTRSFRVSVILTCSSLFAVIWQLGLVSFMGQFFDVGIDPYSMLVPFLVFAIAMSHGLQLVNYAAQTSEPGMACKVVKQLWKPATLALGSDALGFGALAIIPVAAIQDLAITASLGVLCLFFTTLFFVPWCLARVGIGESFAKRVQYLTHRNTWWVTLSLKGTRRSGVFFMITGLTVLIVIGLWGQQYLQVGDLRDGAPELRQDSQYNQDVRYFDENYSLSTDLYVGLVRTPPELCNSPAVLHKLEALQYQLKYTPGVQSSFSLVDAVKRINQGLSEGHPYWHHIPNDQQAINGTTGGLPQGLMNIDCSFSPLYIFLEDHKAKTLADVTQVIQSFDRELQQQGIDMRVVPAAGNAGIEAGVNESIEQQYYRMLAVIYSVVMLLCLITFRRLSLVAALIVPLFLTSLFCQMLMVLLGIGVKVSTLPVIALGVGIGVDYGIYVCARYLQLRSLRETLADTGRIVGFTGLALALSVGSWIFSSIQFQADMGVLLTFMFIWNMLGALFLLPALLTLTQAFSACDRKSHSVP